MKRMFSWLKKRLKPELPEGYQLLANDTEYSLIYPDGFKSASTWKTRNGAVRFAIYKVAQSKESGRVESLEWEVIEP